MAIATGGYHALALAFDGTVYTWGRNHYGQLDDNTTTNSTVPIQVPGLTQAPGVNWYGKLGHGNYDIGTSTMSPVTPTWPILLPVTHPLSHFAPPLCPDFQMSCAAHVRHLRSRAV